MSNKHLGSKFDDHLLATLGDDDEMVFLHIKEALEGDDFQDLIKAINDVARARGKSGISLHELEKIVKGKNISNHQKVISILNVMGLKGNKS